SPNRTEARRNSNAHRDRRSVDGAHALSLRCPDQSVAPYAPQAERRRRARHSESVATRTASQSAHRRRFVPNAHLPAKSRRVNTTTPTRMFKMMSRSRNWPCIRLAQILFLACAALVPIRAEAQFGLLSSGIVFDPSNFARNILHYARRLEQMNLQRQQLQQQLVAMRKLRNPNWRQISSVLTQMDALMQQGQSLSYGLRAI